MQSDWDSFLEKYETAPEYVRTVLDSEEMADFLCKLQPRLGTDTNTLTCILNLCTDRLLGVLEEDEFIQELGFSESDTRTVVEKIRSVLENKPQNITKGEELQSISPIPSSALLHAQNDDVLKSRVTEKITERAVPEPDTKPLTREEILKSLAARRTLQSDEATLRGEEQGA